MRIHSYLSPKCEAKQESKVHRAGVFAKEKIKKGELLAIWGGYILTEEEMKHLPDEIFGLAYPVQVYPGFFLGPKKTEELDDAEMFNHSCSPNAGVKGSHILVARKNIEPGEEICFDYETTDIEGLNNMKCNCNSLNCRKILDNTAWKDPEFQKNNKGYLSWYIQEEIKKEKKQARLRKIKTSENTTPITSALHLSI